MVPAVSFLLKIYTAFSFKSQINCCSHHSIPLATGFYKGLHQSPVKAIKIKQVHQFFIILISGICIKLRKHGHGAKNNKNDHFKNRIIE